MKRKKLLLVSCAIALLAVVWAYQPAQIADATSGAQTEGYRVYIDTATGSITDQPTGNEPIILDKKMQNALSTSSEGLREEPSPVAGGGTMIRLEGRFQNTSLATVGADGKIVAPCIDRLPAGINSTAATATP